MAVETKALMTAEEFAELPDNGMCRELVHGEVIEMTPCGAESGRIAFRLALRVGAFVEQRSAGVAYGADTGFVLARDPDSVRAPDVAFVSQERARLHPTERGFFPGPPDLAIEVVSPTDEPAELEQKIVDYLEAGTALVWVVYPGKRLVHVFRSLSDSVIAQEGDTLTGDPVLPGFVLAFFSRRSRSPGQTPT
jgi:Uma2 family endonuclease